MRRIRQTLFSWILLGCGLAASLAHASNSTIRVATYNVENYLIMDRYFDGRWRPAYPKPESEKTALRQVIHAAAPDILLLQEMGTAEFLEELRADLAAEGLDYRYALTLSAADPVRHLAVLSKIEPADIVLHDDLDFQYFDDREMVKRGLLELSFPLGADQHFQVFNLHLKSRFTDNRADPQSELRRTREAEACRNRIIERALERGADYYLIAGDFNDHRDSSAMRRFLRRGELHIGSLVPASDSRGEIWTYFFERWARYELIDAFIASPAMLARIEGGQGHIIDSPEARIASDHRLVYIDIVITE
ncbi:MAG: endonuclease/exonuclease/phosphatase family protein [Puniceicoccaceae bacterium]|nr:MAG: endonuclease/exonuclease/phosphatase family protein [Puniceicoccaceae bacterium]